MSHAVEVAFESIQVSGPEPAERSEPRIHLLKRLDAGSWFHAKYRGTRIPTFAETIDALRGRFPNLLDPPSDDICYATSNRQDAVKAMAGDCDLVLVVGSDNSSNSQRLVEVALEAGAGASHLIDNASFMQEDWLEGVRTVGVTSGASVPDLLVRELLDRLAAAGYADVREVTTAEENLTFSLPKELRKDLRAE